MREPAYVAPLPRTIKRVLSGSLKFWTLFRERSTKCDRPSSQIVFHQRCRFGRFPPGISSAEIPRRWRGLYRLTTLAANGPKPTNRATRPQQQHVITRPRGCNSLLSSKKEIPLCAESAPQ